jgi:hypothetical protein
VSKELNPRHWTYPAERIDTLLNAYCPVFTIGWMANTDISPCTNATAVVHYIAKYASKAEAKSATYKELFKNATQGLTAPSTNPVLSTANRLLNAQEVAHHLLGLSVVEKRRIVVHLSIHPLNQLSVTVEAEDGELRLKGKSWIRKYTDRLLYHHEGGDSLRDVTLWDFVRVWDVSGEKVTRRPRALPRVVNLYP